MTLGSKSKENGIEKTHALDSKQVVIDDLDQSLGFEEGFSNETEDWGESEGTVVEETSSLVSVRRTYNQNGALQVKPWFDPIPDQAELNDSSQKH